MNHYIIAAMGISNAFMLYIAATQPGRRKRLITWLHNELTHTKMISMSRQTYIDAGYCEIQQLKEGQKVLHNCIPGTVERSFPGNYYVLRSDGVTVSMAGDTLLLPLNY